jgi:hypothetical protein
VVSSIPAAQRTLIFAARLHQITSAIPKEHKVLSIFKDILNQLANPDMRGN